jgi:hypothetical protein
MGWATGYFPSRSTDKHANCVLVFESVALGDHFGWFPTGRSDGYHANYCAAGMTDSFSANFVL